MSVYSEITRIKAAKEAIKTAIEEKGVSVGDGTLDTYADKIGEISAGNDDLVKLVEGTFTEFDVPNGVTQIRPYLFCANGNIKKVNIPNGVKIIGFYAFNGCGRLMSVTMPDSVMSIGNFAFRMCPELTEITIWKGVTEIGEKSLEIGSSSKKATIIMKPHTPPTIQSDTIGADVEKIIVPAASLNAYLTATNWAAYANKIVANTDDAPVERWILNANQDIYDDYMYDITFKSNNEIFTGIYLSTPTAIAYLRADQDLGSASAYDEATGWYDQAYRTVDFYEHPTGGLLAWLQENATLQ